MGKAISETNDGTIVMRTEKRAQPSQKLKHNNPHSFNEGHNNEKSAQKIMTMTVNMKRNAKRNMNMKINMNENMKLDMNFAMYVKKNADC
jgi:hypothetical protein